MRILMGILGICLCILGCAPTELPRSDIPTWDEDVPADYRPTETPSLPKKRFSIFSDGNSNYHFRKVRWGFPRERVELSEAGNTVIERSDNAVVYKCKLNGVNCKLIYTFKNNRLRTAGYITTTPMPNADSLIKKAVEVHGMPGTHNTYPDRLEEMVWKTPETVIFASLYPSATKLTSTKYDYSQHGLLKDILQQQLKDREPGVIRYWDGVYAHMDPAFFDKLYEMNFPESELSFYEKQLMGVVVRRGRTIIPGLGTIPR